jgi:hypothetical protein
MKPRLTRLSTRPAEIWLDDFGQWWCGNELVTVADECLRAFGGDVPELDLIDLLTTPFRELDDAVVQRILDYGCATETREILSHHPKSWVRERIAEDDLTDPAVLDRLACGGKWIRMCVANNESTSAATLARLMKDREPDIRWWAGTNYRAPRSALMEMAASADKTSRHAAAANERTHPAALRWLATEPGHVGASARATLTTIASRPFPVR